MYTVQCVQEHVNQTLYVVLNQHFVVCWFFLLLFFFKGIGQDFWDVCLFAELDVKQEAVSLA